MCKKLFTLTLLLIFLFNTSNSFATDKTVYIDIDYVLNNSNLGKSIYKELEIINKENLEKLSQKEKIIKEKKETIENTKNIASKEKLENDINEFKQEVELYKNQKDKILDDFKKKKQLKLDNFLKVINPIIQEYMKKNSIDIVLERNQIFIGNSKNDITNDILKLINQNFNNNG